MSHTRTPVAVELAASRIPCISLSRIRNAGYFLLLLQLVALLIWSTLVYHRYALTYDYSVYHQAWYEIAHGNLNPYDNIQGFPFWQLHGEFIFWPLALFYWVWPHDVMLLWIQDAALVGAKAVAFTWICEMVAKRRVGGHATWLIAIGLLLLIVNPWTWYAVAWDYHSEQVAVLFLLLLLRDLANGRRRAWAWAGAILVCGDVAVTYVVGAGIGAAAYNRKSRRRGLMIACTGAVAFVTLSLIHANLGSGHGLQTYDYLAGVTAGSMPSATTLVKGVLTHPLVTLQTMASKGGDILANLAPSGFVGLFFVPVLPVVAIVLLANNLYPGLLFAAPGFQSLPIYILLPVGTVGVLAWAVRHHKIMTFLLAGMVAVQAIFWTAVWAPRVPGDWLRVPAATAATLSAVQARIPGNAEVIVSQGVSGRFSSRTNIIPVMGPSKLPVQADTWFIIVPTVGIETETTASAMAFIDELAGPIGARLVIHANGVWAFRWRPPSGVTTVTVPGNMSPIEAWVSAGAVGRSVLRGPASNWHVAATGAEGYVADQLEWQAPPGRYVADVTLSASTAVNVEVWNNTSNKLLSRRSITATNGIRTVAVPVNATVPYRAASYSGWGPFRADYIQPPSGERLEVRVWSPGNASVNVYNADLITSPTR